MADHSTVITDTSQLVDWVAAGAKPKPGWRIGTEHEKILFHRGDFSPVAYEGADGVGAMLGALCAHIGDKARPIMEKDHIIGLKDATGNLERAEDLITRLKGSGFMLYSGDDATACDFMLMGGHGDISVTANVAPQAMHDLCAAAVAGDADKAHQINTRLMPLHTNLGIESNPIPVKWALHRMGYADAGIRLPLTWLSEKYHATVSEALQLAGVVEE